MRKLLIALAVFSGTCYEAPNPQRSDEAIVSAPAPQQGDTVSSVPVEGASSPVIQTPAVESKSPGSPAPLLEAGTLNVQWFAGAANCNQDNNPPLQVHAYNKNMSIIRQNKCVNFEAPFIYLLFGAQKALLIDTGATAAAATFPLRATVENLMVEHYGATQRAQITLVVAHSHGHGDHRAADAQFNGQVGTTVVGTGMAAVASFFGITSWPEQMVDYDLGGRVLKVIPIPGHEASSVAFYDKQTGSIFSGDSLYPGRLYIESWEVYRASIARLKAFSDSQAVSHVLGAHIEISKTPGQDYPIGSTFQPDEHALALSKDSLILLDSELKKIGTTPMRKVLDEFIISP